MLENPQLLPQNLYNKITPCYKITARYKITLCYKVTSCYRNSTQIRSFWPKNSKK